MTKKKILIVGSGSVFNASKEVVCHSSNDGGCITIEQAQDIIKDSEPTLPSEYELKNYRVEEFTPPKTRAERRREKRNKLKTKKP